MKKVYAIVNLARQVDGEFVFVKIDKAYVDRNKAQKQMESMLSRRVETLPTPSGSVECLCERGLFEIEVEE